MSTKATIFLTKDNEHCYFETTEYDGGKSRVYLEIDKINLISYEDIIDGLIIAIKGDSELADYFRRFQKLKKDI